MTLRYTITIEHYDGDEVEHQSIRMLLTDAEFEVIQRLCDASDGRMYIDLG